jgi:UrcA family protein
MTVGEIVMKKLLLASIAFGSMTLAAQAAPATKTVAYADLDLSGRAGAEAVLRRIERAAESVCGGAPSTRDMSMTIAWRKCVDESVSEAVDEVDAPLVTTIHDRARGAVNLARN